MQDVPIKPFIVGVIFSSFLWALAIFAFNFETKMPNYQGLDQRYELYEASVTENQTLYDSESGRTLVWIPGNPKNKVVEVKQISDGKWHVVIEKVY